MVEAYQITVSNLPYFTMSWSLVEKARYVAQKLGWGLNNVYWQGRGLVFEVEKLGSVTIILLIVALIAAIVGVAVYGVTYEIRKLGEADAIAQGEITEQKALEIISDPTMSAEAKEAAQFVIHTTPEGAFTSIAEAQAASPTSTTGFALGSGAVLAIAALILLSNRNNG